MKHTVFCQPVNLRKLGYETIPYGVVLCLNAEKSNLFFHKIEEKYEDAKKSAKDARQQVPDGYEYLERKGQPYFRNVDDEIFNKVENSDLGGVSFPDLE